MTATGLAGGDDPQRAGIVGGIESLVFLNLPSVVAIVLGAVSVTGRKSRFIKQPGGWGIILSIAWLVCFFGLIGLAFISRR